MQQLLSPFRVPFSPTPSAPPPSPIITVITRAVETDTAFSITFIQIIVPPSGLIATPAMKHSRRSRIPGTATLPGGRRRRRRTRR